MWWPGGCVACVFFFLYLRDNGSGSRERARSIRGLFLGSLARIVRVGRAHLIAERTLHGVHGGVRVRVGLPGAQRGGPRAPAVLGGVPVPQEYLGNCLRPCFVEVATRDLLAAAAIGAAIRALDDGEGGVMAGAEGWFQKILSLVPHRPMSVGGSPRYGVYGTDFGLGRPRKVELVSIDKTPGTVSLAEGTDEGRRGIEVGVALPEAEMARFASCFSDGLLQL